MKSDWSLLTGLHRQHCNKYNIKICTMNDKWNNWGTSVDHWEDLRLRVFLAEIKIDLISNSFLVLKYPSFKAQPKLLNKTLKGPILNAVYSIKIYQEGYSNSKMQPLLEKCQSEGDQDNCKII